MRAPQYTAALKENDASHNGNLTDYFFGRALQWELQFGRYNMNKIRNQHGRTNHKKKGKAQHHMPALATTDTARTNFPNPLTEK